MIDPRGRRYESLDVWRGAACLAVVAFHAAGGYVDAGRLEPTARAGAGSWADWAVIAAARLWVGVPVFFVVSGYCIAAAADAGRGRPAPAGRFLRRRFRRIYPPLWAFLAVTAAAFAALPPDALPGPNAYTPRPVPYPGEVSAGQWAGAVTLTEEWRYHLGGPPRGYFLGHLWTLCYEEQFYLVVGLLVAVARRWLFPAVGVVTALVFLNVTDLTAVIGGRAGAELDALRRPLPGCFFDGLWLAFAAGVGVYYRTHYATPVFRWCLDGLLIAGLLWIGRWVPGVWGFGPGLPGYLVVAFASALLLGWSYRFDAAVAGFWPLAPVAWCGRMCYSLYLVHAPVTALTAWHLFRAGLDGPTGTVLVTIPAGVAASVGLGYGFHRAVERRFLNASAGPACDRNGAMAEAPTLESMLSVEEPPAPQPRTIDAAPSPVRIA